MKRQALNHTKMDMLMRLLGVPRYVAVGILESLWHVTAREAPCGDIGRLSDERIAVGIDWRGATNRGREQEANRLIRALVEARWIDVDPEYRLVVHDWSEHADESVKKYLKRNGLQFVSARRVETYPPRARALPEPVPEPEPKPVPEPEAALVRDALGPIIPIRTAKEAGLLPPANPATAEEPAPREGAAVYLSAYPVQVAQDSATRAYLSIIRTKTQHDELMAGIERHKASALWRDAHGELNMVEIAKWYPPDKFITARKYRDHPPPWAPRRPTDARLSATEQALAKAREREQKPC